MATRSVRVPSMFRIWSHACREMKTSSHSIDFWLLRKHAGKSHQERLVHSCFAVGHTPLIELALEQKTSMWIESEVYAPRMSEMLYRSRHVSDSAHVFQYPRHNLDNAQKSLHGIIVCGLHMLYMHWILSFNNILHLWQEAVGRRRRDISHTREIVKSLYGNAILYKLPLRERNHIPSLLKQSSLSLQAWTKSI